MALYPQQEKEKLYVELKHILARQPGPEVAEQLQIYQQTLKDKTKQLKVWNISKPINTVFIACQQFQKEQGSMNEWRGGELTDLMQKYLMQSGE